eukprot:1858839-Pyramimonas_sp.AAC.1
MGKKSPLGKDGKPLRCSIWTVIYELSVLRRRSVSEAEVSQGRMLDLTIHSRTFPCLASSSAVSANIYGAPPGRLPDAAPFRCRGGAAATSAAAT